MNHALIRSGFLEITGEDRIDFVNGLVTGDVRRLQPGSGTGALLLNHRGHALAQLTVVRTDGLLLLAVEDGKTEMLLAELQDHVIFDQVELRTATGSWSQVTLQAADTSAQLEALRADLEVVAAVPCRRSPTGGVDVFVQGQPEPALERLQALGSTLLTAEQLDLERVRGVVATAAIDAGPGVLPQEAGLEHLVSYTKGCYLGQEIMARIEARGNLRRGLRRLRLAAEPVPGETDILHAGRVVGRLGTVVNDPDASWSALAVLRIDLPADAALQVAGTTARQVD